MSDRMMLADRGDGFERWIDWSPAFDRRDPNPSKNYGIHGCEMRWVLKGDQGATQFLLYTQWMLPQNRADPQRPLPADLGFHAHTPLDYMDGDMFRHQSCDILGASGCYYDGSGLNANRVFDLLCEKGAEAVWTELLDYYRSLFVAEAVA